MKIEERNAIPIDWDKPIETANGYPARVISTDFRIGGETAILVQIEHPNNGLVHAFSENGRPYWPFESTFRNRKTKREGWINIFGGQWVGSLHKSEEAAQRHPNAEGAIATIKIEWEE